MPLRVILCCLVIGIASQASEPVLSAEQRHITVTPQQFVIIGVAGALKQQKPDKALEYLDEFVAIKLSDTRMGEIHYYRAAAYAQKNDLKKASQELQEAIRFYDAGEAMDKSLAASIFKMAAAVATARKDIPAAQAYVQRYSEVVPVNADVWEVLEESKAVRHRPTDTFFPLQVGDFTRQRGVALQPDGSDIAIDYQARDGRRLISLSFYVTQHVKVSTAQYFEDAIQSLHLRFKNAKQVEAGIFAPWGEQGPVGRMIAYRVKDQQNQKFYSGIWGAGIGDTQFMMRISYPLRAADDSMDDINAFIAAFPWPSPGAVRQAASQ